MEVLDSFVFQAPFACLVSGPSRSGKSTLLLSILKNAREMINPAPDRILFCYAQPQDAFNTVPGIELHHGIPDVETEFDPNQNNLLILDDLMDQADCNPDIQKLFTVDSHHKNISIFFITQNIYSKGKCMRTISLNTNYMLIFNNPRDRQQIRTLSRQMFPSNAKFLSECYDDATETQHFGYLFLDLTQKTKQAHRVQTNILPRETRIIYQSK
jgi:hypothetical protein